ncbi:MAG TPA: class I tRNA ligase family protein [Solirubrobacteraceae bacterium]|jgi:methionyl-tRNA synthetase|nr:class I tRNA ligase family protein [Solirubrobacteraceae bacterium]
MPERDLTVIMIPPATANGPLHVGHLSGPYLASDVAARAAKARGERVMAVAGVDVGQNFIPTMAENAGVEVLPMMARCRAEILEAFDRGHIHYDTFVDPQTPDYDDAIAAMVADMAGTSALAMRKTTLHACADCTRTLHHSYVAGSCPTCGAAASGGSCEGCGGFTSAQTLVDPYCDRCGGAAVAFTATVPVLRIEDFREQLTAMWLRAELPTRVRELISFYLSVGLPEIPLAYPTNWGVEGSGALDGMRVDVYAEVGLSLLYGVAQALDPQATTLGACVAAWEREVRDLWQFHGIDNTFYFAIFWPALFAAAGLRELPLRGLVVNEFYTLDGAKFSTSRNHAIWAHEFLAEEDPAIVRLFLSWDRPDRRATDFTRASFDAFRDRVRPLLRGRALPVAPLPAQLTAAERARGEQALELVGFDPALAARSMLALLESGAEPGAVLAALTGTEIHADAAVALAA